MVKDVLRTINKKKLQFLAILLITALGVGFFVGIKVTGEDMRKTAHTYMNQSGALDLEYRNTLGIDDELIEQLQGLTQTKVYGVRDADAFVKFESDEGVMHLIEYTYDTKTDLTISEGYGPMKANEAVVDEHMKSTYGLKIGDTIRVFSNEVFEASEIKIVGFTSSNMYLNRERGRTQLGSGRVLGFMYASGLIPKNDSYTSARLISDDVDKTRSIIEANQQKISSGRYKRIVEPLVAELDKAQVDLDEQRKSAVAMFETTGKALTIQQLQLQDSYSEIDMSVNELGESLGVSFGAQSVQTKLEQIEFLINGLQSNELTNLKEQLVSLKEQQELLIQQQSQLNTQLESETNETTILSLNNELGILVDTLTELNQAIEQLESDISQLELQIVQMRSTVSDIRTHVHEYEIALQTYQTKYTAYLQEKDRTMITLDKAQSEIDAKRNDVESLSKGQTYLFDRDEVLVGYNDYFDDSKRIENIGDVFPLLFFGVSLFVTLSTISRLLDENRVEMGIYKSLGYSNRKISYRFLIFSGLSWLIGAIVGLIVGYVIIPQIIFGAYRIMYQLPKLSLSFNLKYSWLPLLLSLITSVGISYLKTRKMLKHNTSELLRGVSPHIGKRILLEYIKPLWDRMNFIQKVTIRNLSRNKSRVIMTLIGIGGCAGLLITGLGLRYSINSIIPKQFEEITRYDGVVAFDGALSTESLPIEKSIFVSSKVVDFEGDNLNVQIFDDIRNLNEWIQVKDSKTKKQVFLSDNDVVITAKFAKLHNLEIGDVLTLPIDGKDGQFVITQIIENYINHYLYIGRTHYETVSGNNVQHNLLLFKSNEDHSVISENLLKDESVYSVSYLSDITETYLDAMANFDTVVYVIIVAALLLELVVIVNLNSMNLSERRVEIATLKVLGFKRHEIVAYMFREITITTLGALGIGSIFGKILHSFVVGAAEINLVTFNQELRLGSIMLGLFITLIFSLTINAIMLSNTQKIKMIEALKSTN